MATANAAASTGLVKYFDAYAEYHRHPMNKACHYIGLPMLLVVIPGLLAHVVLAGQGQFLRLDLGIVLWAVAALWYLYQDWKIGLPFTLFCLGMYFVVREIPPWILAVGFVVGWVFQFIGHYKYEHRSPAFYKNLEHLLVGPIWMFAKMIGYYK